MQVGDQVVVGVEGIRTVRKPEVREQRQEFSFMGAGVSSERRVELVVEQIAWDLRRIRDQGGKVVVVSGPVAIHTGGGDHLARSFGKVMCRRCWAVMRSRFTTLSNP